LALLARTAGPGGTLLDVGSGSLGLASLLPAAWRVTAVDADFEDYGAVRAPAAPLPGQVIGDVRALPFADRTFDVAVTIDLLEHLPATDRALAISEVCRVARRYAILACPSGSEALAADRRLAARLAGRFQRVPPWLVEHLENGFPAPAEVADAARRFGSVLALGSESIAAHDRLIIAENSLIPAAALRLACRPLTALMRSRRPRARRLVARILRAVRGGDRPPNYRVIVAVEIQPQSQSREKPPQPLP
jgi:SAM-dependent methyltransferase